MKKIKPCICGHHRTCHVYEEKRLAACREEGCACASFYPRPRIYMRKIRLTRAGYGREAPYLGFYFGMTSYHWRREGEDYEWNLFRYPRQTRSLPGGVSKAQAVREAWEVCRKEDTQGEK